MRSFSFAAVSIFFISATANAQSIHIPADPTNCGRASCASAVLSCGTYGEISVMGASYLDGDNYYPPAGPCVGSGCDPISIGNPDPHWDVIGEGQVNTVSYTPLETLENLGSQNSNCSAWANFYQQLQNANQTNPQVVVISQNQANITYNTCDQPLLFLVKPAGGSVTISGNSYLCGTFIVEGPLSIYANGTVTLVGVVLLGDPDSANINFPGAPGMAQIIGKVVSLSSVSIYKELQLHGLTNVLYSEAGVAYADAALQDIVLGSPPTGGGGGSKKLMHRIIE